MADDFFYLVAKQLKMGALQLSEQNLSICRLVI